MSRHQHFSQCRFKNRTNTAFIKFMTLMSHSILTLKAVVFFAREGFSSVSY